MDLSTIAAKSLKVDGVLSGVEETDEINGCIIEVKANVDGRAEDWLVMAIKNPQMHSQDFQQTFRQVSSAVFRYELFGRL